MKQPWIAIDDNRLSNSRHSKTLFRNKKACIRSIQMLVWSIAISELYFLCAIEKNLKKTEVHKDATSYFKGNR